MADRPYTVLSVGMSIDGYIDSVGEDRLLRQGEIDGLCIFWRNVIFDGDSPDEICCSWNVAEYGSNIWKVKFVNIQL